MSHFFADAKHPITGEVVQAEWLDGYFGGRNYGVRFPSGEVFPARECLVNNQESDKLNRKKAKDLK